MPTPSDRPASAALGGMLARVLRCPWTLSPRVGVVSPYGLRVRLFCHPARGSSPTHSGSDSPQGTYEVMSCRPATEYGSDPPLLRVGLRKREVPRADDTAPWSQ